MTKSTHHSTDEVQILSAAWGMGAQVVGCRRGPTYLAEQHALDTLPFPIHWQPVVKEPKERFDPVMAISQLALQIARQVDHCVLNKQHFVTIGGDHSCAIGTWSGAAHALASKGDLGLIWFDAHQDAHTFATTPSNSIHGMPIACLLGYGEAPLLHILQKAPKIKPQHLCLIGVRSYEEGEAALLEKLGVRVFMMDEVVQKGLDQVMQEAMAIVTQGTVGYGVSVDLDALDPDDAPGVCSKVAGGLYSQHVADILSHYVRGDKRFIGAEIAEFNPELDKEHKTVKCIQLLMNAFFGK